MNKLTTAICDTAASIKLSLLDLYYLPRLIREISYQHDSTRRAVRELSERMDHPGPHATPTHLITSDGFKLNLPNKDYEPYWGSQRSHEDAEEMRLRAEEHDD